MQTKMKIYGSETLDNPAGIVVTRKGAQRFAERNMPADLKAVGFVAVVVRGFYGDYWRINYGYMEGKA